MSEKKFHIPDTEKVVEGLKIVVVVMAFISLILASCHRREQQESNRRIWNAALSIVRERNSLQAYVYRLKGIGCNKFGTWEDKNMSPWEHK